MPKEYIEREALEKELKSLIPISPYPPNEAIGGVIESIVVLNNQPAADVAPVVHGKWIVLGEFFGDTKVVKCPCCGEEATFKFGKLEHINYTYPEYKYCPYCGVKMDGERRITR